jgi:signal transduction histidine kinase
MFVARLEPGEERTRTYGHVRARLDVLARSTGTRLYVIRPDRTALADSDGRTRIGEPVAALERDRLEIAQAAAGRPVASQVMFEGSDGLLYKSGYAPLRDAAGKVVAVVGADGTAASFATFRSFRRLLATLAVAGAVLGALVAAGASLSVTRPLTRLAEGARRIGRGDLETPLWPRRRRDELGMLRDTLEEMRKALRARDEERETLLAGIAHEVRNPLGVIFNSLGSLRRMLRPQGDARMLLDIVGEEADRLNRIVGDLLDFARPSTPEVRPEPLDRVVDEALATALAQNAQPIEIHREVDPALPQVPMDARLVRQAVVNVAVNAVQAMPRGGRLTVRLRRDGDAAVLELEDTGAGIPDEVRGRIFEPFFTTKASGTGLGLAVVRRIVEGHGGEVAVTSRPGAGTAFALRFPLTPPAGEGGGPVEKEAGIG